MHGSKRDQFYQIQHPQMKLLPMFGGNAGHTCGMHLQLLVDMDGDEKLILNACNLLDDARAPHLILPRCTQDPCPLHQMFAMMPELLDDLNTADITCAQAYALLMRYLCVTYACAYACAAAGGL